MTGSYSFTVSLSVSFSLHFSKQRTTYSPSLPMSVSNSQSVVCPVTCGCLSNSVRLPVLQVVRGCDSLMMLSGREKESVLHESCHDFWQLQSLSHWWPDGMKLLAPESLIKRDSFAGRASVLHVRGWRRCYKARRCRRAYAAGTALRSRHWPVSFFFIFISLPLSYPILFIPPRAQCAWFSCLHFPHSSFLSSQLYPLSLSCIFFAVIYCACTCVYYRMRGSKCSRIYIPMYGNMRTCITILP